MFANTTPGLNLKAGRHGRGPTLQSTVQEGLVSFNYFQSLSLGGGGVGGVGMREGSDGYLPLVP